MFMIRTPFNFRYSICGGPGPELEIEEIFIGKYQKFCVMHEKGEKSGDLLAESQRERGLAIGGG